MESVAALLECGANVDATDETDFVTPLLDAAQRRNLPIVMHLLKHDANASVLDILGRTAERIAQKSGFSTIVQRIQDHVVAKEGKPI